METILLEIEKALKAGLYYIAVMMALALPDICAALESANGETSGPKYKSWYVTNFGVRYPKLSANDCYKLRCGIVHQGRLGHPSMQYGRIILTLPNTNNHSCPTTLI
jgi:hypothetical protein